jgi:hypothetical protein
MMCEHRIMYVVYKKHIIVNIYFVYLLDKSNKIITSVLFTWCLFLTDKRLYASIVVYCVWNVMAHSQKPDFVFRRKVRVHLNRRRRQFSRLLAAEVCASAIVMLDTPFYEIVSKSTGCLLHSPVSPSLPLPCVTVYHHISAGLYQTSRCHDCLHIDVMYTYVLIHRQ